MEEQRIGDHQFGASVIGRGVNFAIFSQHATAVDLCLFDAPLGQQERARIPLSRGINGAWYVFVEGLAHGQLYGFRVDGPYAPRDGHRFNANKLLIDPYARAVTGEVPWSDTFLGYRLGDVAEDLSFNPCDSAPFAPKSIVVDDAFDWGNDRPPRTAWEDTVIYECHVKGLTKLHPRVPECHRGKFLGLAQPPVIEHLKSLGITAVELLPVHHRFTRRGLAMHGLTDYWGYNTIGFFAPDARFANDALGGQVREFKSMVKTLHGAGIEVILDVVYNHCGEGDHLGPTLSFRGIDNAVYYRLDARDASKYENHAGCGNCLNASQPRVLQLIMDSLRYWVNDMHVDGFRFDLATVMARNRNGVDPDGLFYSTVMQDPVLSKVKLIAEPWDIGPDGYRVGSLPAGWSEWNDRYRDSVRRFWRGDHGEIAELARRVSGSQDLFRTPGRTPSASINYVACHDGYTLNDLVSYEQKHNQANCEESRDGADVNLSRNWGLEGPADDPAVCARRAQMQRGFLATLALSLGVPMLQAGDELGRTQAGNNNAYCHDHELTWVPWEDTREDLLQFCRQVFALRTKYGVFRRDRFLDGRLDGDRAKDVTWLTEHGTELTNDDWNDRSRQVLGMQLRAEDSRADSIIGYVGRSEQKESTDSGRHEDLTQRRKDAKREWQGRRILSHLILFNASEQTSQFRLPACVEPGYWVSVIDTFRSVPDVTIVERDRIEVAAHSMMLLNYLVKQ